MFKFISRHIITGLITVLPIVITLYFLYWFAESTESVLKNWLVLFLPYDFYMPGMGVIAGLLIAFLIGMLMHAYLIQRLFEWGEKAIFRMPLVKSIYGGMRDFFSYFSPNENRDFQQVVAVNFNGSELIGFITRESSESVCDSLSYDEPHVVVYLPMSYMIGGFTLIVPKSNTKPVNMTVDQAMKFAITAGISKKRS